MAIDATELFRRHRDQHRLSTEDCERMRALVTYTRRPEESMAAMLAGGPKIIISASGMATGGRVLHHLKALAGNPRHCIVFPGFQAAGTRGAVLLAGATSIKIHGTYHTVRAQIARIDSLSAHADYREILDWLARVRAAPRTTYVVHGEASAQDAMRLHLADELGWHAEIPDFRESVQLG
jgi:metallo-beta-lactamase family protein